MMETLWWYIVLIVTIIIAIGLPGLLVEFYKQIMKEFFDIKDKEKK